VLVAPYGPSLPALIERMAQDSALQLVECVSAMDALSVVRRVESCLVIAHMKSSADGLQHLTLLKTLQAQIRKKTVRVVITSALEDADLTEKINYSGCSEVLPEPLTVKALLFKIERHLKLLPKSGEAEARAAAAAAAAKAAAQAAQAQAGGAAVPVANPQDAVERPPPPSVRWGAELAVDRDFWLLARGGARRNEGQWLIRLQGPAPHLGRWQQEDDRSWRWTAAEGVAAATLTSALGSWLFKGLRPEYRSGLWHFAGSTPSLGWRTESGEVFAFKFGLNAKGSLAVARDSRLARETLKTLKTLAAPTVSVDPSAMVTGDVTQGSSTVMLTKLGETPAPASISEPVPIPVPIPVEEQTAFSPLALAFLAAELVGNRTLQPAAMGQRYCGYVSSSLGRRRVELWACSEDESWTCAGASDGLPGQHVEVVSHQPVDGWSGEGPNRVWVCWVRPNGTQGLLGALVVHCGEQELDAKYAEAAGHMASGLLLSYRSTTAA
jgi:CheY-like chemotaxis protein